MEDFNKDMDDLFKAGLGSYTENPPAEVWPALEKRLDKKRKRPAMGWFWPLLFIGFTVVIAAMLPWGISKEHVLAPDSKTAPYKIREIGTAPIAAATVVNTPGNTAQKESSTNTLPTLKQKANPHQTTIYSKYLATATPRAHGLNNKIQERPGQTTKAAGNTLTEKNLPHEISKAEAHPPVVNQANGMATIEAPSIQNNLGSEAVSNIEKPAANESVLDKLDHKAIDLTNKKDTADKKTLKIKKPIILSSGIAAGAESGLNAMTANKALIAPYIQLPLTSKLALKLQPTLAAANVAKHNIGGTNSFYQRVANSTTVNLNQQAVVNALNPADTLGFMVNYNYTQNHDSVAKSYSTGGSYFEFQMPVLLQYTLSDKLQVYGGPTLVFSKYVPLTEHTYNSGPLTAAGSSPVVFVPKGETNPQAPPADSVILLKGTPLSQYNGPAYTGTSGTRLSLGYMLGISYTINKRWSADLLLQQSPMKANLQGNYNVNTPLSAPYIRLMIGYKFKNLILRAKKP
jgi:hypothetical protein